MAHRGPDRRGSGPGRGGRDGRRARRDAEPGSGPVVFVARPFEGLPGETDWVALREFVPAATATVTLAGSSGVSPAGSSGGSPAASGDAGTPRLVHVASVLPLAHPAIVRADGAVWLGLQASSGGSSGDASREIGEALERALAAAPGTALAPPERLTPGPRLQDLLDPGSPFEVTVHRDLEFWSDVEGGEDSDEEVRASRERATQSLAPTERILDSESAYRTEIGRRTYVRWVLPGAEMRSLDAVARLYAGGAIGLTEGSRLLGSFRACGLLVPVWEISPQTPVAELVEPLTRLVADLADARSQTVPLSDAERRSRAGLLAHQITVR